MSDLSEVSDRALDHIAYLTRSRNRIRILDALAETVTETGRDPAGYERRDLRFETDVSDATLNRTLNEFEERDWVRRTSEGEYAITSPGHHIVAELTPLLVSIETLSRLGDEVALLPHTEMTIGLHHFNDASVRHAEGVGRYGFGEFLLELGRESSVVYSLTYLPGPANIEPEFTEAVIAGELEVVQVGAERLYDYINTYDNRDRLRKRLQAGAEYYSYSGHIPCNIIIFDETVVFENSRLDEFQDGTAIESRNETVREWALEIFGRYREASEEFTIEDFPE